MRRLFRLVRGLAGGGLLILIAVGIAVATPVAASHIPGLNVFQGASLIGLLFLVAAALVFSISSEIERSRTSSRDRSYDHRAFYPTQVLNEGAIERAQRALDEVRTTIPLLEAELTAQQAALDEITLKLHRQQEDADRHQARAKLYEEAAEAVRDLVAETAAGETRQLRADLRAMERRARREQVIYLLVGSLLGATLGALSSVLLHR
jgi:hypothetical protein